jgi:hypothetical protein
MPTGVQASPAVPVFEVKAEKGSSSCLSTMIVGMTFFRLP